MNNAFSTRYKILLFCAYFTLLCWIIIGVLDLCKGDVENGIIDLVIILPVLLMLAVLKSPKLPLSVPTAVLGGFFAAMLPLMAVVKVLECNNDILLGIMLLSGISSIGTGIWGSITAFQWIKERCLTTFSEQDWQHTAEVGSILIKRKGDTNIVDTKEAKIIEINKESWDFITEPDAPDFAQKFENLIKAYFNNAYLDKEHFPDRKSIVFFMEWIWQDNWLYKLPISDFAYLKDGIIKGGMEVEKIRYAGFCNFMEAINMIPDYIRYFGESEGSARAFTLAYAMLLKAHKKGYEDEKRRRKIW